MILCYLPDFTPRQQVAFKAVALKPDAYTMKQPEALLHSLPFNLSWCKLCSSFFWVLKLNNYLANVNFEKILI